MSSKILNRAFDRLARAESAFMGAEFLAPVTFGHAVSVSIANVRCTLRVLPADYHGWGIFRPISHACARAVAVATAQDRRRYLDLFPVVRLIALERVGRTMNAVFANGGDQPIQINEPANVQLAFGGDIFDTLLVRFDGSQFWYDQIDPRADRGTPVFLRRELARMTDPICLNRPGLTQAHRHAYALQFDRRLKAAGRVRRQQEAARLLPANANVESGTSGGDHAGGCYRITRGVGDYEQADASRRCDLTLLSTGICVRGRDRTLDLRGMASARRAGRR